MPQGFQGRGRAGLARARTAAAPGLVLAFLLAAELAVHTSRWRLDAAFALLARDAVVRGSVAGSEELLENQASALHLSAYASPRRRDVLVAASAAAFAAGATGQARAELELPVSNNEVIATPPSKLQRVVVNLGTKEQLSAEVKFWTAALGMKRLGEYIGSDGLQSTVVGFPSGGKEGAFGLELKVDPAVLTRKPPSPVNFKTNLAYIHPLNFIQVGFRGKAGEALSAVQEAGGSSLIGDAEYLDVQSPRGIQLRVAMRQQGEPKVEIVSFNVEDQALDDVKRFYIRALGFKEARSPEVLSERCPTRWGGDGGWDWAVDGVSDEEEVELEVQKSSTSNQKLSAYLEGQGGPTVLLAPIPDGRLQDTELDEFESVVVLAPDIQATLQDAEKAIAELRGGASSRPSMEASGSTAILNDGVGNMISLLGADSFEQSLQSA
mmetsp:Transcript_98955/g.284309  ORF Transcript_98955/g.284309 Transcript_98955/m.284309 type:complete len:437 (+) Transcript_98955:67-1377(+)